MEEMAKLESLEFRVYLEDQVQWEVLETKDQWVIKAKRDHQESQDQWDLEVILARMGLQEFLVHLVKLALLVREVL